MSKKRTIGFCKLCRKEKELKDSHIIPRAFVKRLSHGENKGESLPPTWISSNSEQVKRIQDSLSEYMLCCCCEKLINHQYEEYSIKTLRSKTFLHSNTNNGINITGLKSSKLLMFFVSILWRAGHSQQPFFSKIILGRTFSEYLRCTMLENEVVNPEYLTVLIYRMLDKTQLPNMPENWEEHFLNGGIFNAVSNQPYYGFCIEGFLIKIFVPGLKTKERTNPGIIRKGSSKLFIPVINIFDVNEFISAITPAYLAEQQKKHD